MKISKNLLSKINLFALAFNATVNPDIHYVRMLSEAMQEISEPETKVVIEEKELQAA